MKVYRWMLAGWMALMGCVLSPVWAYTQASQPQGSMQRFGGAVAPSYQFRSTSPLLDNTSGSYGSQSAGPMYDPPRRKGYWNSDGEWVEEGDPIGNTPDPAPVGGPYILLAMAAAYLLLLRRRRTA